MFAFVHLGLLYTVIRICEGYGQETLQSLCERRIMTCLSRLWPEVVSGIQLASNEDIFFCHRISNDSGCMGSTPARSSRWKEVVSWKTSTRKFVYGRDFPRAGFVASLNVARVMLALAAIPATVQKVVSCLRLHSLPVSPPTLPAQ